MPYIKDGRIAVDPFVRLADDAAVPAAGAIMVSAARLMAQPRLLLDRVAPLGVLWPNDRAVAELAPQLAGLALVALVFPRFQDGRAYSQARLLRERHGFRGELRATGEVLRDQFLFLARAGFDSLEVSKEADATAVVESMRRYSVFYQPTGDGRSTALHRRLAAARRVTAAHAL
ncbi:MAG: DUF934 domain-containing protein [Hyphomicrobiales bacterium]|nr:DUF934 domain-containing protein [Hyphomicrobiales bacterium]